MRGDRLVTPVSLAVLTAVAVAVNARAPTVFFDSQIMLGGSLGVFALLQFGWPGLVVGLAALAVTFVRWGHPFELLVGTGFLVWLRVSLDRAPAARAGRGHVRVLLAATAYWLLVGLWLEMAFFRLAFGLGGVDAASLGLKEAVTGLCNATLGFLLFAVVRAVRSRNDSGDPWSRDLTSGLALATTTIPSIALVIILSGQVKQATLQAQFAEMRSFGIQAARAASPGAGTTPPTSPGSSGGIHVAVREADQILVSSDAALFTRIAGDYEVETPSRTGIEELAIYRPRRDAAVISQDAESYAVATFPLSDAGTDASHVRVMVAQPLGALVDALDYRLIIPSLLVIFGFLVAGATVSSVVDAVCERRIQAEEHDKQTERSLQAASERMRLAAAAAGIGFWSRDLETETEEWDEQMLRIYGVSREAFDGRWEPFLHADDRERASEEAHRLELAKKLKTSLNAAAVAHEINQPLSCVLLRARMGLETATGSERDRLTSLVADAERVVSIIEKMKVLLRNVETVQSEVDLAGIVTSAMHQVKRPLREAGVVVVRRGIEQGCLVRGDEVQLQMIVTNLMTNAIEAIAHCGGDWREIVVHTDVHPDSVELVVGDSGPGWPGGTIDEVLLQTTKPDGAGIGLYVVQTAVENHRGQITVGRSPLGGAEFRIRLPVVARIAAMKSSH